MTAKPLKIRPYARLLTMLGDQLIKNERIALIELVKNSYDADADWVKISFCDFGENYEVTENSKIIIEDNGCGMDAKLIEEHWLNPATPEKKLRKENKSKTTKGRFIQGEKGIGRFAILKLGKHINIFTRKQRQSSEHKITYDFSNFDDDFLQKDGVEKVLFLDDLEIILETGETDRINKKPIKLGARKARQTTHGTIIEISKLKGKWSRSKIEEIYKDLFKLQSIFPKLHEQKANGFSCYVDKDGTPENFGKDLEKRFEDLLDNKSVLKVTNGHYDETSGEFEFDLDDAPYSLSIHEPALKGLAVFKNHFDPARIKQDSWKTECGDFNFSFYVFDFSNKAPLKHELAKADKDIIRPHRIYLYRDEIRVYPYGEPDDDWLRIDQYRGTKSAGAFLSNDQVVGVVEISHQENPDLKDKTNREGLIELGNAAHDFIGLLKTFLAYIREKPYRQYQSKLQDKKAQDVFRGDRVQKEFNFLSDAVKDNPQAKKILSRAQKAYSIERNFLVQRAETTEDLAGVGLSVEVASHDIMAIMHKAIEIADSLIADAIHDDVDIKTISKELGALRGSLSFVEDKLQDMQQLFKSSKQRRKSIRVKTVIESVYKIYKRSFKRLEIDFEINEIGSPLIAKTTDAVLLQLLINLFDNATYWLDLVTKDEKKVVITLNGDTGYMIVSDNGPGISKDDAPYVFEPFYSGKGEDGRGLGLYIARQLLERNDYTIDLADLKSDKILSGANFVICFVAGDE
ncbi:MAG: sensor histidine kinase [Alphaproteobacteria bacterium]|nr:sensor histidine kinase [Alphaproteobacteria bacterium]